MSDRGHLRYRIAAPASSPGAVPARRQRHRHLRAAVLAACWLYATCVWGLWAFVRWSPPECWLAHLIPYGPRWAVSLPLLLLVPPVTWLRARWPALGLTLAVVASVPVWGVRVPWRDLRPDGDGPRPTLRLLTCNVQGGDLRTDALAAFIRATRPDLVLLQECTLDDPRPVLGSGAWFVRSVGEFCLASRHPIADFEALRRPENGFRTAAVRVRVLWSGRTIPVIAVHLMTPRAGLEAILGAPLRDFRPFREVAALQRRESGLVRCWAEEDPGPVVLAGDFNLTVEHPLYRRDWWDYANAFSWSGWGLGHTMFTRHLGLRIDHVLGGRCWCPRSCVVGPEVGSAHRPLVADLTWRCPPREGGGR